LIFYTPANNKSSSEKLRRRDRSGTLTASSMKQLKLNDGTNEEFSQRRRARRDIVRNLCLKF